MQEEALTEEALLIMQSLVEIHPDLQSINLSPRDGVSLCFGSGTEMTVHEFMRNSRTKELMELFEAAVMKPGIYRVKHDKP